MWEDSLSAGLCKSDWPVSKPVGDDLGCVIDVERYCPLWEAPFLRFRSRVIQDWRRTMSSKHTWLFSLFLTVDKIGWSYFLPWLPCHIGLSSGILSWNKLSPKLISVRVFCHSNRKKTKILGLSCSFPGRYFHVAEFALAKRHIYIYTRRTQLYSRSRESGSSLSSEVSNQYEQTWSLEDGVCPSSYLKGRH